MKSKATKQDEPNTEIEPYDGSEWHMLTLLGIVITLICFAGLTWSYFLEPNNYNSDNVNRQVEILSEKVKTIDYDMSQEQLEQFLKTTIKDIELEKTGGTIVTVTPQSVRVIYDYKYYIKNKRDYVNSSKVFAEVSAHYKDGKLLNIALNIRKDWNK